MTNNVSSEVLNYFKLLRLLDRSSFTLRQLFKNRYSQFNSGATWDDSPTCGKKYITNMTGKNKKILAPFQRISVENGDSNQWDSSTLLTLLLEIGGPTTLNPNETQQLGNENKLLKVLKIIRNRLEHSASTSMDEAEYNQMWTDLSQILLTLGDVKFEVDKLKDDRAFDPRNQPINEENVKEALRLNSLGTQAHKDEKFSEAIVHFTEATRLADVPDKERAVFYSNISSSRLKLYEQQLKNSSAKENDHVLHSEDQRYIALRDAKTARDLTFTWWKGHFRVGKVYASLNEHEKAIHSFELAFALLPGNDEIKKSIG